MLHDIKAFGAELQRTSARPMPENVAAVRWLDLRFEPIMEAIPAELFNRLEAAEIFHQLLEHRWYMAEQARPDVTLEEALEPTTCRLLATAPDERVQLDAEGHHRRAAACRRRDAGRRRQPATDADDAAGTVRRP